MANKFYITSAIHYSSGLPHIGHAYEEILVDVIARYKRLIGYDVYFLTGLDEHGQKISEIAKSNNQVPQEWTNYIYSKFKELWNKLDISNDGFIRTTNIEHKEAVQKIFSEMYKNKDIYLGEWKGLYCIGCEEPYTYEEAIKKDDVLYCRVGHKLIERSESSYFFKMNNYNKWIKTYFNEHDDFIIPSFRMNEMKNNFIDSGLEDLSVSRVGFDWGIPIKENKAHTIYVWLDALFNYVTALGFKQGNDKLYKKYWSDKKCEVLHVVGKDIVRFHSIFWPIMLHSLQMRIPNHVLGHGWIMAEDGRKMSKSFGNVIDPNYLIDNYGSDITRYYFIKEFLIDSDNNFSMKKFIELYNSDLANIYGNIVSRTIGMINLYNAGVVAKINDVITEQMKQLLSAKTKLLDKVDELVNQFKIRDLLIQINEFGKEINKYIENTKPWELNKSGNNKILNNFLFYLTDAIKVFTILLKPILTKGVNEIIKQMNFTNEMLEYKNIDDTDIVNNLKVNKNTPIYDRIKNN